jgi:hypothetical protein
MSAGDVASCLIYVPAYVVILLSSLFLMHKTRPLGKPRTRWEKVFWRDAGNKRMNETSRRQPITEASSERDQGPEGAVVP